MRQARALPGLFQRFDQEEDFGGHRVVQIGGVGEGAVAVTADDALKALDKKAELLWSSRTKPSSCELWETKSLLIPASVPPYRITSAAADEDGMTRCGHWRGSIVNVSAKVNV